MTTSVKLYYSRKTLQGGIILFIQCETLKIINRNTCEIILITHRINMVR